MSFFTRVKQRLHESYTKVAAKVGPALDSSHFIQEGKLTHEEFVETGDTLVFKCPTWSWEAGEPKSAVQRLPKDKQFLITRKVPCVMRATELHSSAASNDYVPVEVEGDEGWVCDMTDVKRTDAGEEDMPEMDAGEASPAAAASGKADAAPANDDDDDSDDIPDFDDFDLGGGGVVEEEDEAALTPEESGGGVVKTRTYDISITYDNYYNTPKVWLFGYDEDGKPLTPEQMFEDISEDHAKKTVTMAAHPHLGIQFAYIHPCKHAPVMKSLIDRQLASGKEPRVDQYLFLFLKFISSVLPTIEYDFSFAVGV